MMLRSGFFLALGLVPTGLPGAQQTARNPREKKRKAGSTGSSGPFREEGDLFYHDKEERAMLKLQLVRTCAASVCSKNLPKKKNLTTWSDVIGHQGRTQFMQIPRIQQNRQLSQPPSSSIMKGFLAALCKDNLRQSSG